MGHPRTARGAGRREETRHHQGGHRQEDLHRGVQPHVPRGGDGVHGQVGEPHAQDGLLGQHGRSVHHLRQQVHRDAVVAPQAALRQRPALQGLHHPALLARRRNGTLDPRTEPAGLLPRREGHDLHVAVPRDPRREERETLRWRRGRPLLPGLDHHAVDAAFEHRAGRRPGDRIREGQVPQPLHRPAADGHPGQGPAGFLLHQEDGRHVRDRGKRHGWAPNWRASATSS